MKDILKQNKRHFTIKCIITIGIHLLNLLERLHSIGYIHCDIKPDNIMIGDHQQNPNEINKLYLVDFSFSQKYIDENGNHFPLKTGLPFKGNVIFSSKNVFKQVSLSRRDDIISLMYLLIFFVNSNLKWIDNTKPISS